MRTQSGAGGQGVGAVRWLAAARLRQVSSGLVAEIQTEATLMLGAKSGRKRPQSVPPVVNYSTQSKI